MLMDFRASSWFLKDAFSVFGGASAAYVARIRNGDRLTWYLWEGRAPKRGAGWGHTGFNTRIVMIEHVLGMRLCEKL